MENFSLSPLLRVSRHTASHLQLSDRLKEDLFSHFILKEKFNANQQIWHIITKWVGPIHASFFLFRINQSSDIIFWPTCTLWLFSAPDLLIKSANAFKTAFLLVFNNPSCLQRWIFHVAVLYIEMSPSVSSPCTVSVSLAQSVGWEFSHRVSPHSQSVGLLDCSMSLLWKEFGFFNSVSEWVERPPLQSSRESAT